MENTEKQKDATNKEVFITRMKTRYPEDDFTDEEVLFGKANADYDENEKSLEQYRKDEKILSDLFTSDPRSAAFLSSWKSGEDPVVLMIERFGDDFRVALDDPEKADKIKEAQKKYLDRIANEKKLDQEFEGNLKKSLEDLEKYAKDNGLSEDQVEGMYKKLSGIAGDYVSGIITADTWDMVRKAMSHDEDVAVAAQEAEVKAKNAKSSQRGFDGGRSCSRSGTGSGNESRPAGCGTNDYGSPFRDPRYGNAAGYVSERY